MKKLFVLAAIMLMGMIQNSFAKTSVEVSYSQSVDDAKQHLTEILSKALKMKDSDAVKAFFSKEFKKMYNGIEECEKNNPDIEMGFWNGNLWDGGQDSFTGHNIVGSHQISESVINMDVLFLYPHGKTKTTIKFVLENGDWYIDNLYRFFDDINKNTIEESFGLKKQMEEYIQYYKKISLNELIEIYKKKDKNYANQVLTSMGYEALDGAWKKGEMTITYDGKVVRIESTNDDLICPFPKEWYNDIKKQGFRKEDSSEGQIFRTDYHKQGMPIISDGSYMEHFVFSIGEQAYF